MSWTWVTDHWRLKALSVVLALILFGTVAFAQNPITVKTLSVRISSYQITDQNLVLIQYPSRIGVTVIGLADAVNAMTVDAVTATMDLTHVTAPAPGTPPKTVQVNIYPKIAAQGVSLEQNQPISTYVTVDALLADVAIPLTVRPLQPGPGYTVSQIQVLDDSGAQLKDLKQIVHVTGPSSLIEGLAAYVEYDQTITATKIDINNLPIHFENKAGQEVKWPPATVPLSSVDVRDLNLQVILQQGSAEVQVPVNISVDGTPACGYQVSGLNWSVPGQLVTLTGTPGVLANYSVVNLRQPLNVQGRTSSVSITQPVFATTPKNVSVSPTSVTVTAVITQVFTCTPSSPAPVTSPSPLPTPT